MKRANLGTVKTDEHDALGLTPEQFDLALNVDKALLPNYESPWVSWRLGRLDLRGDDDLALTMVGEAVDPPEQVPLRGVTGLR